MDSCESPMISEMLCVPLAGGQALVEMHLKPRFLAGDSVPFSRKRRVKHTFFFRNADRIVKVEVLGRLTVMPGRLSLAALREMVREEIEGSIPLFAEPIVGADPRYDTLVSDAAGRIAARLAQNGIEILDSGH